MAIVTNRHGHRLDNFIYTSNESKLPSIGNVGGGHAVLMYKGQLIVCYNKYRDNWGLPGGGRENGESLSDCIKREIFEEIHQEVDVISLRGVSTVYIPRIDKSIYWAVFYGEVTEICEFVENEEMRSMQLWDMKRDIGDVDEVDLQITKMVLNI
jgi:8-oxo-dGTP diphosphatase